MAQKPKARDPSNKKLDARAKQKEQSARFMKAAREFGVDESGKDFEQALKQIVPTKRRSPS